MENESTNSKVTVLVDELSLILPQDVVQIVANYFVLARVDHQEINNVPAVDKILYEHHAQKLVDLAYKLEGTIEGNVYTLHRSRKVWCQQDRKWNNLIVALRMGLEKQNNIPHQHSSLNSSSPNSKNDITYILEIGFNAGHSSLLFLLTDPNVHIVAFDIGKWNYVIPCCQYLNEHFNNRLTLILGDSKMTVPKYFKENSAIPNFIFAHIDGDHSTISALADLENCWMYLPNGTIVCMDDTDDLKVIPAWKTYTECNKYEIIPIGSLKSHGFGKIKKMDT